MIAADYHYDCASFSVQLCSLMMPLWLLGLVASLVYCAIVCAKSVFLEPPYCFAHQLWMLMGSFSWLLCEPCRQLPGL